MKHFIAVTLLAFFAAFSSSSSAQSTPITPVIVDGQVTITVPDSSGGTHVITFPVTAITALNVSAGTDAYTAPASITSVQASCTALTVVTGAPSQCSATVTGTSNFSSGVVWSATAGKIISSGLFTAPSAPGSVTVTATSVQDQTKSATVSITVLSAASVGPVVPNTAIAADLIKPTNPWKPGEHDAGTPGTGTGSNNYPVTGITADSVRSFAMTYMAAGGVRWANSFAKDTASTNFVLDGQFISPDWTHVANLELDDNQVKADGKTSILGTQCSSYSKSWEVTLINPSTGKWHWVATKVVCDPTKWTPNVLHHVRIFGTISASDVSTYIGVELDGVYSAFSGATGPTGVSLGWAVGSVLTNVQIDGLGTTGAATIYSNKLTIFRW